MRKGSYNMKKRKPRYKMVTARKSQVRVLEVDEKNREIIFERYNVYGSYIEQEEVDIDRAIKSLDNIIKRKQLIY